MRDATNAVSEYSETSAPSRLIADVAFVLGVVIGRAIGAVVRLITDR